MTRVMQVLSKEQPFPGLRPFDYGDQDFFFGRRNQVAALYGLLDRSRFVAVIGSSGSGKSSLTRAGLLPILDEENKQSRSGQWTWCSMRPGDAPLASLTDALAKLADDRDDSGTRSDIRRHHIGYQLGKSSFGLSDAVAEAGVGADEKFVLVVDQFEELFRYSDGARETAQDRLRDATSRSEAKRFVELLMQGRRSTERDIRVLITMRSDFIGECSDFPGLPEAVSATQFLVPGLELDQIEQIIVEPVTRAGATFDATLVQQLLADIQGEPDQLPVLQHCLLQLWRRAGTVSSGLRDAETPSTKPESPAPIPENRRSARHIDSDCYVTVGKMSGALSVHAEKMLLDFREPAVEAVFRALSELKDGRAIRRALSYAQLRGETGLPDKELRDIVDRFRADDCSFLVTFPSGVENVVDETVIDVGHEALLRRWERIRGLPGATGDVNDEMPIGWLAQEQKDGRKYQMLLSMLDGNRSTDKVEGIDRHWNWWQERPRTPKWAERYGGNYAGVETLLLKGLTHQRSERRRVVLLAVGVGALFSVLLYQLYVRHEEAEKHAQRYELQLALAEQYRNQADMNFARSVANAKVFLDRTLSALIAGDLRVAAAVGMENAAHLAVTSIQSAEKQHAGQPTFKPSPSTLGLEIALHNTATDILIKHKGSDLARDRADKAKRLAEELVARDPDKDEWQGLLYASKFRYADVVAEEDTKTALAEYRSARDIAQKLADKAPGEGERQYHLAFSTVKIGEMFRDSGRFEEARDELRKGLQIAEKLAVDHTDNAEWQAYAPSTMSKIAHVLSKLPVADLEEALRLYDAALSRQNALVEKFQGRGNAVLVSNRVSTRRGRAEVLGLSRRWTEANAEFDRVIAGREELANADRDNVTSLEYLAADYRRFALSLARQIEEPDMASTSRPATDYEGLLIKAIAIEEKELRARERLVDIDSKNLNWQKSLSQTRTTVENFKERLAALRTPPERPKQ
jgi:tetratricopeptide (TPR) repeat protein